MLKVALTGGIASGKSTVSRLFQALGAPVIDTDLIARELVEPGRPALERIVAHFGPGVIRRDGRLDRGALRTLIFEDPRQRQALEAILHPAIRREAETRLDRLDAPYVILVIPLLVESGGGWRQDRVLLVDVPESLQIQRLMRRDHCSRTEAQAALAAQATREQRQALADDLILNTGSERQLQEAVNELHRRYLALARGAR